MLLAAYTTLPMATATAAPRVAAVQDEIACYNVITGRTFSAANAPCAPAVAATDGQVLSRNARPVWRRLRALHPVAREEGENNDETDCLFGPGYLVSRGKPVQAFSSPNCAQAKVEFRQCLNGTLLGSYQYPNCQ